MIIPINPLALMIRYREDLKHGQGHFKWPDKRELETQCSKLSAQCSTQKTPMATFKCGSVPWLRYVGEWVKGKQNGQLGSKLVLPMFVAG